MKMKILFVVLCVLFLQTYAKDEPNMREVQQNFEEISPANYVTINKRKYYISTAFTRTALEAMTECNDLNMVLVSFETEAEYLAVRDYVNANGFSNELFWTSGEKWMDSWRWSATGHFFTFSAWYPGEPNTPTTSEVCMYFTGVQDWRDDPCLSPKKYMCEQS